jgi:hypothetical protein
LKPFIHDDAARPSNRPRSSGMKRQARHLGAA